ncbi:peptidase inhibitor family I36 protein [Oerskovia sp. NPDC056781]|uniref:Peptidase inhibitor family I36 protein n=1 Tax=Oerskovia rustica TaxID=2762237 RepID=A0ABR8RUM3_9CELL|nr:peptidase inhibitor family I36 protein [Oerskovia rustica]MBD7951490.1 peptidase inhibitor family I36 protein [Oerskovia rustica]
MNKRFLKAAPVGLLLTAGLLVGGATSASAAASDCAAGYACMWNGESFPGAPNAYFQQFVNLGTGPSSISSVVNNGNTSIARFYDGANYTGLSFTLNNPARGGQWQDPMLSNGLNHTSVNWDNRIKSAKFI